MREIVLDTETTGLDPLQGDRIVEIGCVALENRLPTGDTFHCYINPERDVPDEAAKVHGLTTAFLSDKPVFSQIVDAFLEFIGDAPLIIHNASFDMGFINAELARCGLSRLSMDRVTDTLSMARKKFPGSPASLDALCRRFKVDLSVRKLHGALLDSQLLAEVYLQLSGGRQHNFSIEEVKKVKEEVIIVDLSQPKIFRQPRIYTLTPEEEKAHQDLVSKLKNPIWKQG